MEKRTDTEHNKSLLNYVMDCITFMNNETRPDYQYINKEAHNCSFTNIQNL